MAYVNDVLGEWTNKTIPTKANTAYVAGEMLYNDGTDTIPAVTTTEKVVGFVVEAKASANNTNPIVIRVPRDVNSQMLISVSVGTIAATGVGLSYDCADSTSVTASTTTYKPLTLQKFIDSTHGLFSLNYLVGVDNT